MLNVSPMRSLGAKLFYLMSGLVLLTIAGNSWQSGRMFRVFIERQIQETTLQGAEVSANEISAIIENWTSQVSVALPTMRGIAQNDAYGELKNFVAANKEFIAIQVFLDRGVGVLKAPMSFAFTNNGADPRFDRTLPKQIEALIPNINQVWLAQLSSGGETRIFMRNNSAELGIPTLSIAIRFDVQGQKESLWAVLTTWQTRVMSALPKSKYVNGVLIDHNGTIFSSPIEKDLKKVTSLKGLPLAREALKGRTPSGYKGQYKDSKGHEWIGSFSRLNRFNDFTVLIQRDAASSFVAIKQTIRKTALWGSLFILIAVMFSFVGSGNITKSLRQVTEATQRIANGDFEVQIKAKSRDEVGILSRSISNMAVQIKQLMSSQVEKARFEKELETAKMVQSAFFPRQDIVRPMLRASGSYEPASECGGDLWGHFAVDDDRDLFFIADAMGHGAPAALVTAIAYSTCMTVADLLRNNPLVISPAALLDNVNRIIFDAVRGDISMTFFAMLLNRKTGEVIYSNGGHNFPLVVPNKANDPRVKKRSKALAKVSHIQPITLQQKGVPLGIDREAVFKETTFQLFPGDKLFLYTDGLIECESPEGETWGKKILTENVACLALEPAEQMRETILAQAHDFFAEKPRKDDITVLVVELDESWPAGDFKPKDDSSDKDGDSSGGQQAAS